MKSNPKIVFFIIMLMTAILIGCAASQSTPASKKRTVKTHLSNLKEGLKLETWDNIRRFFSSDYYEGYQELRDRIESRWAGEDLIDIQFIVDRVLESDGLLNAKVRWHKSFLDNTGKPRKKSGVSEIILKPKKNSFRILSIKGDRFF